MNPAIGSELSAMELADKFLDLWEEAHDKNKHDHQWLKVMYRRHPLNTTDSVREALAARRTARGWPDQVEELIMMLWVSYEPRHSDAQRGGSDARPRRPKAERQRARHSEVRPCSSCRPDELLGELRPKGLIG
jgi:hypothetical protein